MQLEDIPSPGYLPNAIKLRQETYRAISYASTQADLTKGESDCAATLHQFYLDAAARLGEIVKPAKKKETK